MRHSAGLFVLSIVTTLVLTPVPALPQDASTDSLLLVLRRLEQRHAYVRVSADTTLTEGPLRRVTASALSVGGATIQLNTIDRVEHHVTRGGGAKMGAIAGGIALGVVWLGLASDPDSGGGKDIGSLLGGFGLGAGIGMLIGYVVNPGTREWQTVWRSD